MAEKNKTTEIDEIVSSMGQVLSGCGHLVYEGEMLDTPISWHPEGIPSNASNASPIKKVQTHPACKTTQ